MNFHHRPYSLEYKHANNTNSAQKILHCKKIWTNMTSYFVFFEHAIDGAVYFTSVG